MNNICFDTKLTVDGETEVFTKYTEAFKAVNIPQEMWDECARTLLAFGKWDVSSAYKGHSVVFQLVEREHR